MRCRMATYRRGFGSDSLVRANLISRQAEVEAAWLTGAAGGGGTGSAVPERLSERSRRVRELAYRKAERRGFAPGGEMTDWLEAEREVDAVLWN